MLKTNSFIVVVFNNASVKQFAFAEFLLFLLFLFCQTHQSVEQWNHSDQTVSFKSRLETSSQDSINVLLSRVVLLCFLN